MQEVKPTINSDGTETVELYGTTVDVTGKDSFTLFKRDFKVARDTKAKKTVSKSSKAKAPVETHHEQQ